MYYLGPLLQAYGASLNTRMIPSDSGVYLTHFSQGAVGLLHVTSRLSKFSGTDHLNDLRKEFQVRNTSKITLLFDLDETLVHCKLSDNLDKSEADLEVLIRPHAFDVLKCLKNDFQLGLFTSASQKYADEVLKKFDPDNEIFEFRLYKDSCIDVGDGIFIKDLRVLNNMETDSIFLVDNNLYCYGLQVGQGIPILSFKGDSSDCELLKLKTYLRALAASKDPGKYNTNYFGHDILLKEINDNLINFSKLMLERILEVAMSKQD